MWRWSTSLLFISGFVLGLMIWFGLMLRAQHAALVVQHQVLFATVMFGVGIALLVPVAILLAKSFRWTASAGRGRTLLVMVLMIVLIFLFDLRKNGQLVGQKTEGVVVHRFEKATYQSIDFFPWTHRHRYYLDYTYDLAGKSYSQTGIPVSKETWEATASDTIIPIGYGPGDPSSSYIDLPNEWRTASSTGLILIFGFGCWLVLVAISPRRGATPAYQAQSSGRPRWREPKIARR
jgi:hypothetical protein